MAKISFNPVFAPTKDYAVEKSASDGVKHKYIEGVSSGIKIDGHGERMTDACIKSFMEQAQSGQVLLYPDVHGIHASKDIGKLVDAKVLENNDWWTSYRLWDATDGVDQNSIETADKLWKQIKGLPPYSVARSFGFSIEGDIPQEGIISAEKDAAGNMIHRVIDKVKLDGVVLVPHPAYTPSIARAIYKSLGEIHPDIKKTVRKSISDRLHAKVQTDQLRNQYFKKRWDIQDGLEAEIEKTFKLHPETAKETLEVLFEEYSKMMIELLLESEELFKEKDDTDGAVENPYGDEDVAVAKSSKLHSLLIQVRKLKKSLQS
jgi:hypothetical protein